MSPGTPQPNDRRRPAAIGREAADWLIRRQAGLTAAEAQEFERWRDASTLNRDALARLEAVSAVFSRARANGAMAEVGSALAVRARRRRIRRRAMAGAVALLLVGLGLRASVWHRTATVPPAPTVRIAALTQHLPDGSVVELKRGAAIAVHFTAAFRYVDLEHGEAFFHVAHDTVHPFIVRAGGVNVRAVGTAFAVALDPRNVEVLVTEGRVGINNAAHGESLLPRATDGTLEPLRPGQRAVIARRAPVAAAIARLSSAEMARQMAWRTPHLEFDRVPLDAAIRQLNARGGVRISLADPALGRLRLSGSFPDDDPRTFARLAAETFGLECEETTPGHLVLRNP